MPGYADPKAVLIRLKPGEPDYTAVIAACSVGTVQFLLCMIPLGGSFTRKYFLRFAMQLQHSPRLLISRRTFLSGDLIRCGNFAQPSMLLQMMRQSGTSRMRVGNADTQSVLTTPGKSAYR